MRRQLAILMAGICMLPSLSAQQPMKLLSPADESTEQQTEPTHIAQVPDLFDRATNPLYGIRGDSVPPVNASGMLQPLGIGYNNRGRYWKDGSGDAEKGTAGQLDLYHQPLVQIKVRIIEVIREDNLAARTVLDIVRDKGIESLVKTHTLNGGNQGSTTSTRFPLPGSPTPGLGSSGAIVNVTTRHLNVIGDFLATEFKADLVTCPQVVTLNGQKVQLISGVNAPFALGQSVLHDGTLAVQETFYKHVGTNLTVTPRIINWGPRGEGKGRRPIMASEIRDWNGFASFLITHNMLDDADKATLSVYATTKSLIPIKHQQVLLNALNQFDRGSIEGMLTNDERSLFAPLNRELCGASGPPCEWNPSDCTLDIEIVLRQSNETTAPTLDLTGDDDSSRAKVNLKAEEIGAALANVVQLKNGHGAVLAGLIGERDVKSTSKVPILGDLPVVGAAFRSRATNRQKTELVIFLEAEILPADPNTGVAQAAHDFELTRSYLHGDVLSNPLEAGMHRAGIGSYLPPRSKDERVYWERMGRKVRKSATAIHDIIR